MDKTQANAEADAISAFRGSKLYSDLLDSFTAVPQMDIRAFHGTTAISEAMYFHMCKMRYAGWRHRVTFRRFKKHSLSEFFQDVVAFYLKAVMPPGVTVEVEPKRGRTQVDIGVKVGAEYVYLIEVKTNIGWDRIDVDAPESYRKISERIGELSANFGVQQENIIYLFEEHSNVGKTFSQVYWDKHLEQPKPRPTQFPCSVIFPLFNGTDPYYWKHRKGFKKNDEYIELSDEEIRRYARQNIVTPFEAILDRITTAVTLPISGLKQRHGD